MTYCHGWWWETATGTVGKAFTIYIAACAETPQGEQINRQCLVNACFGIEEMLQTVKPECRQTSSITTVYPCLH